MLSKMIQKEGKIPDNLSHLWIKKKTRNGQYSLISNSGTLITELKLQNRGARN